MSLCLRPSDVLLVTYNHMDAIRGFACDNPAISSQVENVYKLLYEVNVYLTMFLAPEETGFVSKHTLWLCLEMELA